MTIPQLKGFLEAINKRKASESALFISNIAVGAQCDSKTIKKAIESYTNKLTKPKI